MKIVVFARIVPDITDELDVADDGSSIDREWIGTTLNEYCDYAIEQALVLKERTGGHVTVVTHDANGDDKMLKTAVARGADSVIKIDLDLDEEAGIGARELAASIAGVIRELAPDLVLTGVQGPEDVFGTFAPYLADALEMPVVNVVTALAVDDGAALVSQEHAGGRVTQRRLVLPVVAGIQMSERPPAFVSGSQLRVAMGGASIDGREAARTGDEGPSISALAPPPKKSGVRILDEDALAAARQLIGALREKALLGGSS